VSTADLAVLGVTVVGLANVAANWHVHMKALEKMGDRLRLVNPPKAPAQDDTANVEPIATVRRTA
jgi:hypothetical protein